MAIIGIDLGTTNSLVSIWRNGKSELIPNSLGEYLTPSVVSFGTDGQIYTGKIAKEMLVTEPSRTFAEFKRNMGTDYEYHVDDKTYRAEELSALLLKRLKEDAEAFLGEEVTEAVVSVPAYFNDDQRCATRNAGKLANLKVERLINEPSAVALKHHICTDEDETFIIFDFGGGTLDISLVEAFDNMVEIQAVSGDNHLGGKDFNEIIADFFYAQHGLKKKKFSTEEQNIVLKEAELIKRQLSTELQSSRTFYLRDKEYIFELSNKQLIQIAKDLFIRMQKPLDTVLHDTMQDYSDIDKVILVGGSSKMPTVKKYLESIIDTQVIVDDTPDESIALGVGMVVGIKERQGDIKDTILTDICPFSLGIEVLNGLFSPIIEKNTPLPYTNSQYYVTTKDYQKNVDIFICQGENMYARDNLKLGHIRITDLPARKAGEVGSLISFTYDINGILDIHIDTEGQQLHKVIVNKNMTLSEEELNEKIEEIKQLSLHSSDDEVSRLLIERAKRAYTQCNPQMKVQLSEAISSFIDLLQTENRQAIREAHVRLSVFLCAIEGENNIEEETFDASFWDDSEQ